MTTFTPASLPGRRPLRPPLRARRVRRRAGRAAGQPADARGRRAALDGAGEPRAPRRRRAPTPSTGDGAGILAADARRASCAGGRLRAAAAPAATASAMCFLPHGRRRVRAKLEELLELQRRASRASSVLGWRDVPVDEAHVGDDRQPLAPVHPPALRRRRRRASTTTRTRSSASSTSSAASCELRRRARTSTSPSFSSRTIVYKGMLIPDQLARLLPGPAGRALRRARWRSCTRASRRTRSRAGSSPTRTA